MTSKIQEKELNVLEAKKTLSKYNLQYGCFRYLAAVGGLTVISSLVFFPPDAYINVAFVAYAFTSGYLIRHFTQKIKKQQLFVSQKQQELDMEKNNIIPDGFDSLNSIKNTLSNVFDKISRVNNSPILKKNDISTENNSAMERETEQILSSLVKRNKGFK